MYPVTVVRIAPGTFLCEKAGLVKLGHVGGASQCDKGGSPALRGRVQLLAWYMKLV
jgi:hypothetical protein